MSKGENRKLQALATAFLREQAKAEQIIARPVKVARPAAPIMLEKYIQSMIVTYLRASGWTVWEIYKGSERGGSVWATPGIPDLFVFKGARWSWLEVKRPKVGRLSAHQVLRHAELERAALPHAVVTSIEEALIALGRA